MTYDIGIRRLAFIKFQQNNGKVRATARAVETSASTIIRWRDNSGWFQKPKTRKRNRLREEAAMVVLKDFYEMPENNAVICKIARRQLEVAASIRVSPSTVRRWMKKMRYTRKRLSSKVLGRVSKEQVHEFLQRYTDIVAPETLVASLDESYFSEKVMPLYGYSKAGERCVLRSRASGGWKGRSLIAAIASDGTKHHLLKEGSINKEAFGEFVLEMPFPPGTVVLMDNCSTHKGLQEVFDAKEYIPLFLSPYSPKFQPVELAFSKIKNSYRNKWPWNDSVETAVEESVQAVTSSDILGFFRHVGRQMADGLR